MLPLPGIEPWSSSPWAKSLYLATRQKCRGQGITAIVAFVTLKRHFDCYDNVGSAKHNGAASDPGRGMDVCPRFEQVVPCDSLRSKKSYQNV
jgi:hypothetical protein